MAKLIAVALVFIAMTAACCNAAAVQTTKRTLLQDDLFTCANLQGQLGTSESDNKCCELCWCMGNQSPGKMLASQGLQTYCKRQCTQCVVAAAGACASGAGLPKICADGLAYNSMVKGLVTKCVDIFSQDPQGALSRAQGC